MSASELKRCPFCKGTRIIERAEAQEDYMCASSSFECKRCGARTKVFCGPDYGENRRKAIAAWNRRAGEGDGK